MSLIDFLKKFFPERKLPKFQEDCMKRWLEYEAMRDSRKASFRAVDLGSGDSVTVLRKLDGIHGHTADMIIDDPIGDVVERELKRTEMIREALSARFAKKDVSNIYVVSRLHEADIPANISLDGVKFEPLVLKETTKEEAAQLSNDATIEKY